MDRKNFRQLPVRKVNSGQAMMEFILGLMVVISFFFFFVKMSAIFAIGNYIHYATFMAARAYSSSAQSIDEQTANADAVMTKMVGGRWKSVLKATGGNSSSTGVTIGPGNYYQDSAILDTWNQGVTYSFNTSLSMYPWSKQGDSVNMKMVSESWMPREDSEDECTAKRTGGGDPKKSVPALLGSSLLGTAVEWDNGC